MTPSLSRDQVRRVDELAVQRYKIPSLMLMENAGKNAAAIIDRVYGPKGSAFVICGTGHNGGDGFVIARHLHNAGWTVRLLLAGDPAKLTPDAAANFAIVSAMAIPCAAAADGATQRRHVETVRPEEVVIDAILGTGFTGRVRPPTDSLIGSLNAVKKRATLAIDVPSGMDCDTGLPGGVCIQADLTITFVARKRGFGFPHAVAFLGRVEVADIGAPRGLIEEVAGGSLS